MTTIEQKKALRSSMLQKRKNVSQEERRFYAEKICKRLSEIIYDKGANNIHSYLPMGEEVDIKPLIQKLLKEGKKVVVPKTLKKPLLEHLILKDLDQLEQGLFGTWHPRQQHIYAGKYDLIIVPGLAFDSANNRLGYGGGYYDHFLKDHPDAFKVGVGYPFQMVEAVPVREHDVVLDIVLK